MKKPRVIHPFLIAVFPALFFVTYNIGEVSLSRIDAILIAIAMPLVAWMLCLLLTRILKDNQKAGLLVSLFFLISFSYTPVYNFLLTVFKFEADFNSFFNGVVLDKLLFSSSFILLFGLGYWVIRTRSSLSNVTRIVNIFAICLISLSVVKFGFYQARNYPVLRKNYRPDEIEKKFDGGRGVEDTDENLPDIYYIVPDWCASRESLKEFFDYDNSGFIDYLRGKGFFVPDESYTNYPKTSWSLASSLNFRYLNELSEFDREGIVDLNPLNQMIKYHRVGVFLRSRGYRYIHLASGDNERTDKSPLADVNLSSTSITELMISFYELTMFHRLARFFDLEYDSRRVRHRRVLYTFDKLHEISESDSYRPKFVFAHILLPHYPEVFEADGRIKTEENKRRENFKKRYLDAVKFANKQLMELVDKILAGSKRPPLIVIQADEGPPPARFRQDERDFDWEKATAAELREKFGILNACYLPGLDRDRLYPGITPVNTFRLIFNQYFHAGYDLLPDRNYTFVKILSPYKFIDVTEKLGKN